MRNEGEMACYRQVAPQFILILISIVIDKRKESLPIERDMKDRYCISIILFGLLVLGSDEVQRCYVNGLLQRT